MCCVALVCPIQPYIHFVGSNLILTLEEKIHLRKSSTLISIWLAKMEKKLILVAEASLAIEIQQGLVSVLFEILLEG